MTQDNAFHDARREHIKLSKRHAAPESHHGKTVGQAATKRHRRAIGGGHVDKIFGKQAGAIAQRRRAGRVIIGVQGGVNQAIEVERHRDVVVFRPAGAIGVPAVAKIVGFHHLKATVDRRLIVRQPGALKAQLDNHREIVPVAVRHLGIGDLIQPAVQICQFCVAEMRGQFVLQQRQPQAVGGHFDQPLIVRPGFAPVGRAVRIGAKLNGRNILVAERRLCPARQQREQPPKRSR